MEPGYVLKEQRMRARMLCAAARLGGEAGHRLGEEGGEWTGRRWRVSAWRAEGDGAVQGDEYRGVQALECTVVGEQWLSRQRRDGSERSSPATIEQVARKF